MKNLTIIILTIVLLVISCKNSSREGTTVSEPKTSLLPTPKTDGDNGGLFLPAGFGALVVVDSVGPSRHIAVRDNGDIYVKLSIREGRKGNVALRDTDNDGKADIIQRWGDYPNDGTFATEMRIHNDYVYFSSELVVYRQKLTSNKLIPNSPIEVILTDRFPLRWHNAKSLAFDNENGMYVTFSAPTNACENWATAKGDKSYAGVKGYAPCRDLKNFGGIWKFDKNKKGQFQSDGTRFATGLRSIVALSWNQTDNSLYALNHGRDFLYSHAPQYYTPWHEAVLPSEEFIKIKKGDNFGWPYSYYDHFQNKRILAPEYGGDGIKEADYNKPLMGLPAHWAPNDLLFYKGDQFPARYKDGAFVAFHGSANRTPYPQAGYIVAFLPFKNGKPVGTWEVFADGFTGMETVKLLDEVQYRPMGLSEGPDGSLYISESKQGKIWRVLFNGDSTNFGLDQLAEMEERKSKSYLRVPDKITDNLFSK